VSASGNNTGPLADFSEGRFTGGVLFVTRREARNAPLVAFGCAQPLQWRG
jgi:hypothetical protein